jgi:hypothetical protein
MAKLAGHDKESFTHHMYMHSRVFILALPGPQTEQWTLIQIKLLPAFM